MSIAVIADIVGSRRLEDRTRAQRSLDESIAEAETAYPLALQTLRPTVGDEQQGVYPTLEAALAGLLLLQLALPDGLDCRFGIGIGPVGAVPSTASPAGEIPEGPGWWAAREAIDVVHRKQQRAAPSARTWIVAAAGEDDGMNPVVAVANAYLLSRDELVGAMSERTRRLTYGRCLGRTQRDLATAAGISQPAVSQALAAAGAASVIQGFLALEAGGSR